MAAQVSLSLTLPGRKPPKDRFSRDDAHMEPEMECSKIVDPGHSTDFEFFILTKVLAITLYWSGLHLNKISVPGLTDISAAEVPSSTMTHPSPTPSSLLPKSAAHELTVYQIFETWMIVLATDILSLFPHSTRGSYHHWKQNKSLLI